MEQLLIQIPAELFALAESSHFAGELALAKIALGPDEYRFSAPVAWEVDITNTGAAFLVAGVARGVGSCACARCLDDVEIELTGDIEGYFLKQAADRLAFEEDDDAPGADEFDVLPDDHRIDLLPLIKAALMVEMPETPLCSESCAGLCPVCGANLNRETCACSWACGRASVTDSDSAHPFAKLAEYHFGDDGVS